ncbi:hypothetical protein [Streptomyces ipomoeae]|uniref:hypothetical protein n=1 Tax=Streptomyces ipomoeae TaxID=103232 RepID=UPI001146AC2D|nr:hypothetical protein [Streptomyces ipomoeae]MDX2938174.1 hypothetical protein [Streptomyces ipomoeae]TQE27013.1 hypothetical protein SipoB123_12560 [Streptomyces ipomoeae]
MVRKLTRGAALAVTLAVLPLMAACSGGGADDKTDKADKAADKSADDGSSPVAAVVAPAKVEVLAQLTGCKVKIRTEAEELREGVCHTAAGDYLITTFPKEQLKLTWLETAAVYGGKYLVGPRWAISAEEEMLKPMQAEVGGEIQDVSVYNTK